MNARSSFRTLIAGMLLCLLFVCTDICAQERKPPTIEISIPNYWYPKTVTSLRLLDVKNSEVIIFGDKGVPDFHAYLRHAIAYYIWAMWAGSSSDYGVVQLLHIEDGHLKIVQQILFNSRGSEKAGAFCNAGSNALTIRGVNDWENCCPTGLDVVKFRLKEGVLKQVYYGTAALE
jgi:hypothetical protein